jgi:hypothetical protein
MPPLPSLLAGSIPRAAFLGLHHLYNALSSNILLEAPANHINGVDKYTTYIRSI